MALINSWISSFLTQDEEEGQGLAEYALILALIAIVAIVALIFLGGQVTKILSHGRQLRLVAGHSNKRPPGSPGGRFAFKRPAFAASSRGQMLAAEA